MSIIDSLLINGKRWKRRFSPVKELLYSSRNSILSGVQEKTVLANWYHENNFGDQITPDILRYYGFNPLYTPTYDSCEIVSVGSILEIVPETYKGVILGTGFLMSTTEKSFPTAKIISVRGKLTAKMLELPDSVPLGDPGILIDKVYNRAISRVSKKYTFGLVPHYKDKDFPALQELVKRYPRDICLIDVRRKPGKVISDIAACKNIGASSLHGLVAAHSMGIPACLLDLHGKLRGGIFKFQDYYSVYEQEPVFFKVSGNESLEELCELASPIETKQVERVKGEVNSAFINFAKNIY